MVQLVILVFPILHIMTAVSVRAATGRLQSLTNQGPLSGGSLLHSIYSTTTMDIALRDLGSNSAFNIFLYKSEKVLIFLNVVSHL